MTMRITSLEQLEAVGREGLQSLYPGRVRIAVGVGSCGLASGAGEVLTSTEEAVRVQGLDAVVRGTGCLGFCQQEPLVDVLVPGKGRTVYHEMTADRAEELVGVVAQGDAKADWALCRMVAEDWIIDGSQHPLASGEAAEPNGIPLYQDLPFFRKQCKIVLRNCGFIDPMSIEQYIARGGYRAVYKALTGMQPQQVIEQVAASGLRGRGGAGFPTARKWQACREAPGEVKYLVCNADEGDPGAYMDRSILEGDPHSVLEGMLIGAYAIGAHKGYLYVRAEYPLAVQTLQAAIDAAREHGLLGDDILGTGFHFDVELVRGAGAFVCGEETALLASIEGTVGEPRQRPPFPAHKGLWDQPTNINNVKSWANVPVVISRGAEWFAAMGTEQSKGTMVFSLVGKVTNTGLVEVPMGISLQELVYDIGGGILDDKEFKAVQTGGPSGGCIPQELIHLPVDYEQLTEAGSMMGSGGMVVMDEDTCMVDVARYFLTFTKDESCGKCTPCRDGTKHMLDILTRICDGEGREGDVELLEDVGKLTKEASLCGLGGTAPNPVLTTIRYFRDEYDAHVVDKKCPAGVCKALIQYSISAEKCTGCGVCDQQCPEQCISGQDKDPRVIDQDKCIQCGVCRDVCRYDAVIVQ